MRGLVALRSRADLISKFGAGTLPMTLSITTFIGHGCNNDSIVPDSRPRPRRIDHPSPWPQKSSRRTATLKVEVDSAGAALLVRLASIEASVWPLYRVKASRISCLTLFL